MRFNRQIYNEELSDCWPAGISGKYVVAAKTLWFVILRTQSGVMNLPRQYSSKCRGQYKGTKQSLSWVGIDGESADEVQVTAGWTKLQGKDSMWESSY